MFKKSGIVLLVVIAMLAAACGTPATTVNSNNSAYPGLEENGNTANTNTGLGNTNSANTNSGLGNTNSSNTNTGNTNTSNTNTTGNTNSSNTNTTGNTNSSNSNTTGNTNSSNTNTTGNTNSSNTNNANTNGGTPAVPAGTGLTQYKSYAELAAALQARGETVTEQGEVASMGFDGLPSGQGRSVTVRGEQVQVIEFTDVAARTQVASALANGKAELTQLFPGMTQPGHVWANGNLVVIYFGDQTELVGLLDDLLGQAILGGSTTGATAPAALLDSVQQWLATQIAVNGSDIQLVSVQQQTFSDSCLGLGGPSESCLAAQTPGWVVVFSANGQQYTAHVSQDGSTMRLQPVTQ